MESPSILIGRQSGLPSKLTDGFVKALEELSIRSLVEEREPRIYAAIEYYLPTAIVVFLAKPFFDGFLKKAGEDAYSIFRGGLASIASRLRGATAKIVSGAKQKIASASTISRLFSVYSESASGAKIKFLIPDPASDEELLIVIDTMIELLQRNHESSGEDDLTSIITSSRTPYLNLLQFDAQTKRWKLFEIQKPE